MIIRPFLSIYCFYFIFYLHLITYSMIKLGYFDLVVYFYWMRNILTQADSFFLGILFREENPLINPPKSSSQVQSLLTIMTYSFFQDWNNLNCLSQRISPRLTLFFYLIIYPHLSYLHLGYLVSNYDYF